MSLIIAGERSGVGKTTVTLTLLASLCRQGVQVQSFKVGPDYIDPMFHQRVTKRPCRNLDLILTSEAYVKECYYRHALTVDSALVEGVMGLFDGVRGIGSTAHVARLLDIPVLLTIDCSRLSDSVAAIAHGYCSLDPRIKIAGLVLNRVGSDRHLSLLKSALEPLELPILGVLRREENITIPDRHLGLVPTDELPELEVLIERLADLGDTCFDWDKLLPLLKVPLANETNTTPLTNLPSQSKIQNPKSKIPQSKIRIAVARDRAFNFYYQDNLDLLEQLGAELVFWSPLKDAVPPKIEGMYFGGGFPEVFAQQLADNTQAIDGVKKAILSGMPVIAECGGLMYLCEQITDFEGKSWSMVGVLPTTAVMGGRLTLGYRRAIALQDSLLVDAGTVIYGHEFHRSRLTPEPDRLLFKTYRVDCEEFTGSEGSSFPSNLHASYIHLHWGEYPQIPLRFLQKTMCRV